jgi:predicted PolB exonuclease-like 3'-5' exonuclease
MFKKEAIHSFLYFDVETACAYEGYDTMCELNPRLAALWSKRANYYRGANHELSEATDGEIFLQKGSLEPEFSRVVCVTFGTFTEDGEKRFISFSGQDEIDILNKSNKVLNNAMAKNWKLCGHNIKGFDVPCLGKRMIFNGINPSGNIQIWDKKPWEIPYVDTSDIFAFGSWVQQKYLSLDLLACSLNIASPKGDLDGSKVNHTYWVEKDYDKISTYCEADVKTVMDVMEKVCF